MSQENEFTYFASNESRAEREYEESLNLDIRTNYQVDRDRILYSKAFRRLRGKTQVFIAGYDDHVRNRLSHTLEVAQIARTIAKALGLNELLTESIALGHDLGHTPFGHVGERVLHDISCGKKVLEEKKICHEEKNSGFKHNWQSVRVACDLEYHNPNYPGLNLTKETLWGFLHHSKLMYSGGAKVKYYEEKYSSKIKSEIYWSFEGIVVSLADEIAQRHHDIEDGLITGILEKKSLIQHLKDEYNDLPDTYKSAFFEMLETAYEEKYPEFYFEMLAKAIVNLYVTIVVDRTKNILEDINNRYSLEKNNDKFYEKKEEIWKNEIKDENEFIKKMMTDQLFKADKKIQDSYFRKRILLSYQAQKTDGKAAYVIKKIVEAYLTNPQQMPDNAVIMLFVDYFSKSSGITEAVKKVFNKDRDRSDNIGEWRSELENKKNESECSFKASLVRTIVDYVSGMTDDYAMALYEQLYGGTKQNRYQ